MSDEKEIYIQFSIRVPKTLDRLLEADKRRNRRSKSEQVNVVLEQHYAAELKKLSESVSARN